MSQGDLLLLDFGASRIKSVCLSLADGSAGPLFDTVGSSSLGKVVPARFFAEATAEHIEHALQSAPLLGVVICCEMHGYFRNDPQSGLPESYVSWRYSTDQDEVVVQRLAARGFEDKVRMRPRRGLPIVQILQEAKGGAQGAAFSFLPDGICQLLGQATGQSHASLAHASGCYDRDLAKLDLPELANVTLPDAVTQDMPLLGEIQSTAGPLKCWGGYGDLQAAVYGIQAQPDEWTINLGTGSQVVMISDQQLPGFEERKYFEGRFLNCISHIPAGRALALWGRFLQDVAGAKDQSAFWNKLHEVALPGDPGDLGGLPRFDLAVFPEAYGYTGGGSVSNLHEGNLSPDMFFAGLLCSFARQFTDIIARAEPDRTRPIKVAGMLGRRLPGMLDILRSDWAGPVTLAQDVADPTLAGMARLVMAHRGAF